MPRPSPTVGMRPIRSVSQPITGDRAYMPATWALITKPTIVSEAPWWRRWTDVIDITPTITAWAVAIASRPSRACGIAITRRKVVCQRLAFNRGSRSHCWSRRSPNQTVARPRAKAIDGEEVGTGEREYAEFRAERSRRGR